MKFCSLRERIHSSISKFMHWHWFFFLRCRFTTFCRSMFGSLCSRLQIENIWCVLNSIHIVNSWLNRAIDIASSYYHISEIVMKSNGCHCFSYHKFQHHQAWYFYDDDYYLTMMLYIWIWICHSIVHVQYLCVFPFKTFSATISHRLLFSHWVYLGVRVCLPV